MVMFKNVEISEARGATNTAMLKKTLKIFKSYQRWPSVPYILARVAAFSVVVEHCDVWCNSCL